MKVKIFYDLPLGGKGFKTQVFGGQINWTIALMVDHMMNNLPEDFVKVTKIEFE